MPKVKLPAPLLVLLQPGKDITQCPKCNTGKLEQVATFINVNGTMVDAKTLRNRGSPKTLKTESL